MATISIVKPEAKFTLSNVSVFETGSFEVRETTIERTHPSSPPRQSSIAAPTTEGIYPVIVFLHGFCLRISLYSELLKHIAGHGYIVVAPQLYYPLPGLLPQDGFEEINNTAAVTDWLSQGLQSVLPEKVEANLLKLALMGHSRGGKTAFSVALDHNKTSLRFSALIGIDPVAGMPTGIRIRPEFLTDKPQSLDIRFPVMVIGTGLGEERLNILTPQCAPDGVNHRNFYYESQPPRYHFITKEYGHMDMLNDDGTIISHACKSGEGAKDPMRRCVGGLVVAFLKNWFDGNSENLEVILSDPSIAPVILDVVDYNMF